MKIYTGVVSGEKLKKIKALELGFMISSTPSRKPCGECKETFCALDNGAYISYQKGYPFMEAYFWRAMEKCYEMGVNLDFIVIPDIVGGGVKSFDFSLKWIDRLRGASLAFVIQSGTSIKMMEDVHPLPISTVFIGGAHLWDWNEIQQWRYWTTEKGLNLHIGRIGTLDTLHKADGIGADSVDSTNFSRNETWDVIEKFRKKLPCCPSCGEMPTREASGFVRHTKKGCFMYGMFTVSAWEHHATGGKML